jgi:hypothetical protein
MPRISLTDAALQAGVGYLSARNKLLRGEWRGGRDENGRFYVEESSITRRPQRQQGKDAKQSAT